MAACPRCAVPGAIFVHRALCLNRFCSQYHRPSRTLYQEALYRGDEEFSGDPIDLIRLRLWVVEQRRQQADQA